jgi:hypothetical protein
MHSPLGSGDDPAITGPMVLALKSLASVSSTNALVISLNDQYLTAPELRYWAE